ncbi:MAG TPA: chromosome segregation protein SMC [Pyrinomonadaceae bacterium]|nr:chromosome segregation protein SMC [Pyrinomonadaceae bacterium]
MFKLQRLEITGFKSFADYTEIVFTGNGITAVVGPNGCGKSNVSDAISWVLGEQRVKSLRGGEMKDVVFAGTKTRKPGGMAEVVLHLIRDDTFFDIDENELEDIDEALSGIDEAAVDMAEIEGIEPEEIDAVADVDAENNGFQDDSAIEAETVETVKAMAVGSTMPVETKVKTKRHWRPRSFALDFAPGEAVSVTRRLYLSGESEYQLNGKTCRLRDITDLFAGTGLSGAHYAIIEQGRIGQILSAKPADRRSLIEEAAGISKFRARQRAAETRLESAKSNLARIFDIVSEIDTRVNSLRRQAAKTRRFKILQEEFRELLRQLYAAEGKYLSDLSAQLKQQLVAAEATETALHAQVAATEEAAKESTAAARAAEESLAELRRIHSTNALERDRAEREHIYKSDQIVGLNNRCETLRGEITASEQRLDMLNSELERLRLDEQHESSEHAKAESALRESEDAHRLAADAFAAIEISMETARGQLMQHTAAAERFDEVARQLEHNLERLAARAEGLDKEGLRADETFSANQKQADELAKSLAAEELKLTGLNAEKDGLLAVTTDARNAQRAAESELQLLQDEHSAKKHRLATLLELEEKRAVYTPQVQKIFAEEKNIGVRLAGVLADRLNVKPEAETAVETLFGAFLEAVVVESLTDAKRVSAWLKENDIGRTAMIILPKGEASTAKLKSGEEDTIADILGVSADLEKVLRSIFPREMSARLVRELDESGTSDGDMLVNYEGDLLLGGKMLVGGNRTSAGQNESLLAFKRELNQLDKDCGRLASDIEKAAAKVETARNALVENESKMVDLQSLIIKVDRGIHGLQIQVRSARDEIERTKRHLQVVADEAGQIKAEIVDAQTKHAEAIGGKESAEAARITAAADIERIIANLNDARAKTDAANAVLNDKRMIAATSDERRRSAVSALRRVENEGKEIESRLALQNLEKSEAEGKIRELHTAINEITDRIASAGDEVESENTELTAAITCLASARENADRMSETLADLNRQAAEARNERAAIEIRQAEAVTELKNIGENCLQELNVSLNSLVAEVEPSEDLVLENARREADDLRQKLENFGAINMLALEELGEAEERHLFLTTQRQDIIDSIAATEEALREIKQRSRDKFRAAFEAINENFVEFFQELFGGGQGQMTLLESDDILEAGIEVVAQPPGKRLQNIMLLSGGEKAMTAIALVMSIFKYRPSPFCLLDEVDAPLDDANVGRFVDKIASMSERTQFIVITHNKRTMEAARALYGVTMQEAGVSKVVSVKFE